MPLKKVVRICFCVSFVLMFFCLSLPRGASAEEQAAKPDDPVGASLKKAMLNFYKGLESKDEKERLAALKALMPNKQDIAVLFPKETDKAWELIEKYVAEMEKNIDKIAAENLRNGAIKDVETIDLRKRENNIRYKELLDYLAKDIPVYRIIRISEKGDGGSGVYVFVNDKWVFIRRLETLPAALKQN